MAGAVPVSIGAVMRGAEVSAGAAVPDGMVGAAVRAGLEWADATVVASAVDRVAGIQAVDIRAVDTGVEDMEVGDTGAEDMGVAATVITSASSRPQHSCAGPSCDRSDGSAYLDLLPRPQYTAAPAAGPL